MVDQHLTRVRNEHDGRSWLVELTAPGRDKLEECRPVMRSVVRRIEERIGPADEVRRVRELLGRLDRAITGATSDSIGG